MKKMLKLRNSIIVILCFTVICMAIGFSILAARLENYQEQKPYFNVVFSEVKEETAVKGGSSAPKCQNSIVKSAKEVNMNCTLYAPHDELSYFVIIKNTGNIDATIVSIKESPNYQDASLSSSIYPVKISYTDVTGKVLQPEEEITMKVYIKYPKPEMLLNTYQRNFKYSLSLIASSPNN